MTPEDEKTLRNHLSLFKAQYEHVSRRIKVLEKENAKLKSELFNARERSKRLKSKLQASKPDIGF